MAIVSFDRESIIDYIPEYGGNRESLDPCIVSLKFVPYSRVQEYSRLLAARTRGLADQVRIAELTHSVQRKQFVENVECIQGYYVGETRVSDPGEFYDTADTDLVLEIIRAMESTSRLSEGQRKN
ncbi:MAG: hypothetical protein H3C68_08155 [Deltaproteobacteria bacterium]|nr:hypothetical protein [Deltaproteobacteria bacterium]MBZ0219340.1 hypothetical protein [Deltaproteobacteria bacterium]